MQCHDLQTFLLNCSVKKGETATHTRIGNPKLNIRGGRYYINYEDEKIFKQFKKLYCKAVFDKKYSEYLTELQDREKGGPILIDLDFHFNKSQTERIFDEDVIKDMIDTYAEEITTIFDCENINEFEIYVLMKDEPSVQKDFSKDGIHIQINLICNHNLQLFLRERIKKKINDNIFLPSGFEFKNSIDDIFDKSISTGQTGWLCYGSKKPGGIPYKIVSKHIVRIDNYEEYDTVPTAMESAPSKSETLDSPIDVPVTTPLNLEYHIEDVSLSDESIKTTFERLLIRNQSYQTVKIADEFREEFNKSIRVIKQKKAPSNTIINNQHSHLGGTFISKILKTLNLRKIVKI